MRKVITLRFPQVCKVCKQMIPEGSQAHWLGKGNGVQHIGCSEEKATSAVVKSSDTTLRDVRSFGELREAFRKLVSRNDSSDFSRNRVKANDLRTRWQSDIKASWTGATGKEMLQWLDSGYVVEGLQGIDTSLLQGKPRRRFRYAEEGDEMLIDLVMSGVDEHFLAVEKRNTKPGLRVEIFLNFSVSISEKVVGAYQRWIARMLQTLEENRVNTEVDLMIAGEIGASYDTPFESRIRVKQAGEAADFAQWSPMFSPGGYRMLGFLDALLFAEGKGFKAARGLYAPKLFAMFDVAYDEESNTMQVINASGSAEFPEFEMTQKFQAVLAKVSG